MLGERDRVREAVGWDLVEPTTTAAYTSNVGHQSNWESSGIGNASTEQCNNGSEGAGPPSQQQQQQFIGAKTQTQSQYRFGRSNTGISNNGSCGSGNNRNDGTATGDNDDDDEDDYDDATNNQYGEASGGGDLVSNGCGTMAGKEVRYAPLPIAQSPTFSNPITHATLQRTHSR